MSPAAKGRRAPSGSCVVAEGGPNSIRAEISRSHGTAPLVPMTPASAKPETGRPGGGYAPVGVGPTPLPRWQAPGGAAVSVLVCAHELKFPRRPLFPSPTLFTHCLAGWSVPKMSPAALGSLPSATWVDETLLSETDRAIVIRFGRAADPLCQQADAQLVEAADELVLEMHAFTVELDAVPDFTAMYELHARQHGHQTPALARCQTARLPPHRPRLAALGCHTMGRSRATG